EFKSDPSDPDWERFDQYAGYIRSIHYNQLRPFRGREGLFSNQTLTDLFLHHPTSSGSLFPRLADVRWMVTDDQALMQLLPFIVPTITILHINCRGPWEDACLNALNVFAPRNIHLTELRIAMTTHTQTFLEGLPDVLAYQRRLTHVGLPHYSASRGVVAALAALPVLEEYELWSFFEYQTPLGIGMEFDWEEGGFAGLKKLALIIPPADAAIIMSRSHQPRLDYLTIINRGSFDHTHLRHLSSSLSASQPNLIILYISIYPDTLGSDPSSQTLPFELIRPLLLCTALEVFSIGSEMAMSYNDEDIASMASAWPRLRTLSLCADPVSNVGFTTGQRLQSIGSFTNSFRRLRELSLYVNTWDIDVIPGVSVGLSQPRLSLLNFGTSPVPPDNTDYSELSLVVYVASLLELNAEIESERSESHKRFLNASAAGRGEYSRRERFWSHFARKVQDILSGTTGLTQEVVEKSS
ncbi:hypothetical protein FRB98_001119, partial [Tulasnella sp. 332]